MAYGLQFVARNSHPPGVPVSRVSAKRIAVVVVAGLALVSAVAVLMLDPRDSLLSRSIGVEAMEWAVPLLAGLFVGFSAWALLGDDRSPSDRTPTASACPRCGRSIRTDWRLCPHCGALLAGATELDVDYGQQTH
jgi:hypothetical protein